MAQEQGPMSGFRDMLADQMIPRQQVLDTIRGVYEDYGFVPLKTPALERLETMTGKYGDEGEKLMYQFKDNGGRDVAMRYDQTVPLARVVAQHGGRLPSPYKRYALGDVWRGESPQAGRYREFTQFDADTVGTTSFVADTEIIAMMHDSMQALGLDTVIRVNDRRLLDGLATACGIEEEPDFRALVGTIDKIDKAGKDAVLGEVGDRFGSDARAVTEDYLAVDGDNIARLDAMSNILGSEVAQVGIQNLRSIMGALALAGYDDQAVIFDPTIARGLDYYTGTIYETTLTDLPSIGSVCSGGRFDNLIEAMGGPSTPAVGTSIGVDRLIEGMRQLGVLPDIKTQTEVMIASMEPALDAQRFAVAQQLRRAGIATDLVFDHRKLGKQLRQIEGLGVDNVILLGEEEAAAGSVTVRNLATREQVQVSQEDIVNYFVDGSSS